MAEESEEKVPATIQTQYSCSKCGALAEIKNNEVIRTCDHKNESVIASISSVCHACASLK